MRLWTEEEEQHLRRLWGEKKTVKEIAATLGRTWEAVHQRTRKLGLRRYRRWKKEDIQRLRELFYDNLSVEEIAEKIGRTPISVTLQIRRQKLRIPGRRAQWTDKELDRVRELAPTHTPRELSAKLGRSIHSIYSVLARLRLEVEPKLAKKLWTPEEDALLRRHAKTKTEKELAEMLGRTECSISNRLWLHRGCPSKRFWTEEEIQYLLDHHETTDLETLAKKFDRTPSAVEHKLRRLQGKIDLGIWSKWTREEDFVLFKWWGFESPEATAKRISRSVESCRGRIRKLRGTVDLLQGKTTIGGLAKRTGYTDEQIRRAVNALGIRPNRTILGGKKPWNVLSDEQEERVLEYLARPAPYITRAGHERDRWARYWDSCQGCGKDGNEPRKRHYAKGLCFSCYHKRKRKERKGR